MLQERGHIYKLIYFRCFVIHKKELNLCSFGSLVDRLGTCVSMTKYPDIIWINSANVEQSIQPNKTYKVRMRKMLSMTKKVWQDPVYFLALGFGSGLLPYVPGTWGTLAAIPVYALLNNLSWPLYLIITTGAFFLGLPLCQKVSDDLGVHDHSSIVWDEVVGYLLTMFLAPPGILWMFVGFILFRIFDIWKPQPIGFIDKQVGGGVGIMLDDVLAAIPSWIILQCLAWGFS